MVRKNTFVNFVQRKVKGKTVIKGTFLGTHKFTKLWGTVKPHEMEHLIESNVPEKEDWVESPSEIKVVQNKLGIRLDRLDNDSIETDGPVSFIPRMICAVTVVPKFSDSTKQPVVALVSYDAVDLSDGQVPAATEEVEFFITLIRFDSNRKVNLLITSLMTLWKKLEAARKQRLQKGLEDAKINKTNEKDKLTRRESVSKLLQISDDDDSDYETETMWDQVQNAQNKGLQERFEDTKTNEKNKLTGRESVSNLLHISDDDNSGKYEIETIPDMLTGKDEMGYMELKAFGLSSC